MSVLRNIERKIGDLVEGAFGQTLRSGVQPVELARKLAKEMDDHRTISIHRVYVPNSLHGAPQPRGSRAVRRLRAADDQRARGVPVRARPAGGLQPHNPAAGIARNRTELSVGLFGISVESSERRCGSRRGRCRCPAVARPAAAEAARRAGGGCSAGGPAARRRPRARRWCTPPCRPRARTRARSSHRGGHAHMEGETLELTRQVSTIGRSSSCAIVVHDANVSRTHAEIRRIGEGTRSSTWDRPTAPRSTASR